MSYLLSFALVCFLFKQKTAYEMLISDWSSDVCSSDLRARIHSRRFPATAAQGGYRGGIPSKSIAQDMTKRIRKAVFPVAGLGTRFLPATKTVPKEMLPIIDRPLIQYAVDEAIEAGCDTLIFVTNRYKHAVADYFDRS